MPDTELPNISSRSHDVEKDVEKEAENDVENGVKQHESKPPRQPSFPEGGARAWAVVAGAFCILFCTFGWMNTFGVFQSTYQAHQLSNEPSSTISWIGSVQTCLLMGGGIIGGPLFDRYGAVRVSTTR